MKRKHVREPKLIGIPDVHVTRPYGVGVDVAEAFHAVCVLVPIAGTTDFVKDEFEIDNTPKALRGGGGRIRRLLRKHGIDPDPLGYAVESTATFHCPLVREWGGEPCVVNPALAASFKARKTDRIDAFRLAQQHLMGLWRPTFQADALTELLRLLTRTRKKMKANATRVYNAINTRLWQWNCMDATSSARKPLVRACIEDLAQGKYAADLPIFKDHKHVPDLVWNILSRLYRVTDACEREVAYLEAQIKEAVKGDDLTERLYTIPGWGPVTIATWLAEVEPCSRFPTVQHCVAFCGLDPTPQISGGKKIGSKLRLGNSQIRPAMIQAGSVCLNGKSMMAQNAKLVPGNYKRRVCILARKLVTLAYMFSTRGGSYDESKVIARVDRGTGLSIDGCRAPAGVPEVADDLPS